MIKKLFKNDTTTVILIFCIVSVSLPFPVYSQQPTGGIGDQSPVISGEGSQLPQTVTLQNPLKVKSIGAAVNEGAKIFSYLAVLFAVAMLIWVGLQFILARGNKDRLTELKGWLTWIVVGIAIVISARIIIQVVVNTLEATKLVNQEVIQGVNQAIGGQ